MMDAAAPKLTVELVPKTCWWSNLRSLTDRATWDRIRRPVYRKAEYHCEICGASGSNIRSSATKCGGTTRRLARRSSYG
jgi:5-methylcytosine-specific restriction endonuclease McrA